MPCRRFLLAHWDRTVFHRNPWLAVTFHPEFSRVRQPAQQRCEDRSVRHPSRSVGTAGPPRSAERPGSCSYAHRFRPTESLVSCIVPQSSQRPSAELAIDGRPLAELLRQVPPWRARPSDPENTVQNKAMVRRFAPVRTTNSSDEGFEKGPFVVGYQVACHDRLPSREWA